MSLHILVCHSIFLLGFTRLLSFHKFIYFYIFHNLFDNSSFFCFVFKYIEGNMYKLVSYLFRWLCMLCLRHEVMHAGKITHILFSATVRDAWSILCEWGYIFYFKKNDCVELSCSWLMIFAYLIDVQIKYRMTLHW